MTGQHTDVYYSRDHTATADLVLHFLTDKFGINSGRWAFFLGDGSSPRAQNDVRKSLQVSDQEWKGAAEV